MKDAKWWREYRKKRGQSLRDYDRNRKRAAKIRALKLKDKNVQNASTPKATAS